MAENLVIIGGLLSHLSKLFEKMVSRELVDFFRARESTSRISNQLETNLMYVSAVLDDAKDKQFTNSDVKKWLDGLKDAAYDAEDILDEIATEASRRQLDAEFQTITSKVRNSFTTSLNPFVKRIETKIKELLDRLEYLANQKDLLRLKEDVGGNPSERDATTFLVKESDIYGRNADKKKIINLLLSDDARDREMGVIAIVGMGGIGKTTLAQLVYNDNGVKKHFELQFWVCVSDEFDVLRIMKTILESTTLSWGETLSTRDINDLNGLQVILKEKLRGKRFLLVLDDVWNENSVDWKILSDPFKYGARGSRVLVTTRNYDVASGMLATATHRLKMLSEEDCWSLFASHAFHDGNYSNAHPLLEVLGREIVKKCNGLPLAVKTLGAILRSRLAVDEWDMVLKGELWDSLNRIIPALSLSYKYLPAYLKRCFAYCSIFPTGYVFEKDELVLLWMAEGFLQHSKDKTMEEVGDSYFLALQSRSFFQQSGDNKSRFVMHDIIRDLAKFVSGQFSFNMEVDYCEKVYVNKIRHLSYLPTRFDKIERFKPFYHAKRLRTFLPLNISPWGNCLAKEVPRDLLPTLRRLRVLSLSYYDNVAELPKSIGKIKSLRYLNLSFTAIKRLPNSISKLCNLQTLKLSGCQYLVTLPVDMWKLINLRHLDITRTGIKEMPIQLGRLKCLQTLTKFIVSKRGSYIQELGKLVNLRGKLSILELQNIESPEDALNARLTDREYLEELALEWNALDTKVSEFPSAVVLENLQPHTNLKSLTIIYYGGKRFPDWVGNRSFSMIESLHLFECKYSRSLPPLGQLPSLQYLSIVGLDRVVTVGPEFYGSTGKPFGALKVLRFEKMLMWKEWITYFGTENEGGAFCQLIELHIDNCPKLTGGLPIHLSSLTKLEISICPQLVASLSKVSAICELQLKHCNEVLLKELPTGMQKLDIEGFDALEFLPKGIMDSNCCIEELRICDCSSLMSLSKGGLPSTLKTLTIRNCWKLELPMCPANSSSLERLSLVGSCNSLRSFPLDLFPKLKYVVISGCRNLESLVIREQHDHDLVTVEIDIRDCPLFVSFPKGGLRAPDLVRFRVNNCGSLRSLPDKMFILLPSLKELCIHDCPEVESFPEGGLPSNLTSISIKGCDKLVVSRRGRGL